MEYKKATLSERGRNYLVTDNCTAIVGAVFNSILRNYADVVDESDEIVRIKLNEKSVPTEILENNYFAVHKEHLILY